LAMTLPVDGRTTLAMYPTVLFVLLPYLVGHLDSLAPLQICVWAHNGFLFGADSAGEDVTTSNLPLHRSEFLLPAAGLVHAGDPLFRRFERVRGVDVTVPLEGTTTGIVGFRIDLNPNPSKLSFECAAHENPNPLSFMLT